MSAIFCCSSLKPYKPKTLAHEPKFSAFMKWSSLPINGPSSTLPVTGACTIDTSTFVVQVVRQQNFDPLEGTRYFMEGKNSSGEAVFSEITEQDIIDANFKKLNTYKNFKCSAHNLFFEINIYQKDPVNQHHWRANVARPASKIDLPTKSINHDETPGESSSSSLQDNMIKEETAELEEDSLGQVCEPKPKSDTAGQLDTDVGVVSEDPRELHVEGPVYFDDDYDDDKYGGTVWSRSSSRSGVGDDFTACSADDCGYCGRCSY